MTPRSITSLTRSGRQASRALIGSSLRRQKNVKTGSEANVNLLIADLFRAIETDTQSVASFYEARGVLEMLLAVYASQLQGGRVSLPLKERKHPLGALTR